MEKENPKLKILVLGAGGNVSQGIIKALRNSELNMELIGACISSKSIGLYMCDRAYISPYANDDNFIEWLIELCNREEVDIVLTGVEENICAIQRQIGKFREKTKAVFVASEYDRLMIGQDKYLTCEWLKENGCNYPEYCKLEDAIAVQELVQKKGFPLIAKPRNGKSSNGVYKIETLDELNKIREKIGYVLEECVGVPEQEYTVGCYCDKKGHLQDIIIMHRHLQDGSTAWAEVVENEDIYKEAEKICKAFKPSGPLNIQLRMDKEGKPVCFELNVRFSGTTPMRSHFGYKDVEAMVREYVFLQPIESCFDVKKGIAVRYTNELYMDVDACASLQENGYEVKMQDKHIVYELMESRKQK